MIFHSRFVSVCPSALSIGNVLVGQGHIVLADVTVGGQRKKKPFKFHHSAASEEEKKTRREMALAVNIVVVLQLHEGLVCFRLLVPFKSSVQMKPIIVVINGQSSAPVEIKL